MHAIDPAALHAARRSLLFAMFALLGGCAPTTTGSNQVAEANYGYVGATDEALDDAPIAAVDDAVEAMMTANDIEGCGVALVDDRGVFYARGYGYAHLLYPWDVSTTAPVGSVSKTFTALAVLALAEDASTGVQVTDQARDHLPAGWWPFTVHNLLAHRTGLSRTPSFGDGPDVAAYDEVHPMAHPRHAFVEWSPFTTFTSPSGSTSLPGVGSRPNGAYSNAGYAALGALIDEVAHDDGGAAAGYEAFVWHRVLRGSVAPNGSPTGALMHTWRQGDIPNLAVGFDGGIVPWEIQGPEEGWEGPAGGWTMTIGDLGRFTRAVARREIVSAASWAQATTSHSAVGGSGYGYGMFIDRNYGASGRTRLWHGGDISGTAAHWAVYEQPGFQSFGVALQCNGGSSSPLRAAGDAIFAAYRQGRVVPDTLGPRVTLARGTVRTYAVRTGFSSSDLPGVELRGSDLAGELTLELRVQSSGALSVALERSGSDTKRYAVVVDSQCDEVPNPLWVARAESAVLPRRDGTALRLTQARLSGVLTDSGRSIDRLRLEGLVDVRTVDAYRGRGDVCSHAARVGRACQPCADGASFCVPMAIEGWTAESAAR